MNKQTTMLSTGNFARVILKHGLCPQRANRRDTSRQQLQYSAIRGLIGISVGHYENRKKAYNLGSGGNRSFQEEMISES